jgi:hypothetical protein
MLELYEINLKTQFKKIFLIFQLKKKILIHAHLTHALTEVIVLSQANLTIHVLAPQISLEKIVKYV